ncbi:MAG: hypothetical protein M1831_004237 [Alyxoria varia]|nr:MAG: hypothetical protein M1831_004237 [Alyxoria varia]
MSQRRRRRRDMMEECAIDTEVVTGITSKKPSNADLIFLSDYQWTEIEKQRWIECNGACKQTLCQAQMNWWNGTPTLVLPVYANLLSPSAHYVPAGPEHDAQDGALIVLQETTSNDSFVTYFDTLNGLRDAGKGTGTKGRGESFNKAIIDRSKPRAQSYEDRLFKWASAWLASHRIEPNNLLELSISHATIVDAANSRTDQLIQRVENLAEERPSLLQLWDDAIERTYV